MKTIEINGIEFECTRPKIDLCEGNELIIVGIIGDYRPESNKMHIVYEDALYRGTKHLMYYYDDKDVTEFLIWIES